MPHVAAIWLLFLLGQFVHVLKRAGMALRGKNGITSRGQYVAHYWDGLLIRLVLSCGLFLILLKNPKGLVTLLGKFGITGVGDISVDVGTALVLGYCMDSVLDWLVMKIPALGRELPPVNGNGNGGVIKEPPNPFPPAPPPAT